MNIQQSLGRMRLLKKLLCHGKCVGKFICVLRYIADFGTNSMDFGS
jgi:hypothetical protein